MNDRYVTQTGKDGNKTITSLCNPGKAWSPRNKKEAIADIENGDYRYYAKWSDEKLTEIKVVGSGADKYLRTDRDDTTRNNLRDLPNC